MTYKQAFDKITEAYIKGEIEPLDPNFCFCGTLCNNETHWYGAFDVHNDYGFYKGKEYTKMEAALFSGIQAAGVSDIIRGYLHPKYEDALFAGMCAALEVLKQIHRDRGEVIDEMPFVKRQIV